MSELPVIYRSIRELVRLNARETDSRQVVAFTYCNMYLNSLIVTSTVSLRGILAPTRGAISNAAQTFQYYFFNSLYNDVTNEAFPSEYKYRMQ